MSKSTFQGATLIVVAAQLAACAPQIASSEAEHEVASESACAAASETDGTELDPTKKPCPQGDTDVALPAKEEKVLQISGSTQRPLAAPPGKLIGIVGTPD